jgi:hypothetical protein
VIKQVTPAAVELALDIRKEIETRLQEADQLRCRAIERAQIEAELAERRFMRVDPNNRLVADTLESDWNEKLRALAKAREERERCRREDQFVVDEAVRQRLLVMTTDFQQLWADPATPNRERKRMLAHIVEDATLIKCPEDGYTKIHVRFKGGKTETLTVPNPKSSAQQVTTPRQIVAVVDELLDEYTYSEIADRLNDRGLRPGGAARPGQENQRFCAKRVAYLVHAYGLRSRHDRLRARGMLTAREMAGRLGVHEDTIIAWARCGILRRHAYNGHAYLYQDPGPDAPSKHPSRWDRLVDRVPAIQGEAEDAQDPSVEAEEV